MDKQDQAFNRLLKKLSALRATLKGDERNLLDGLITAPDEARAHTMKVTPISPAKTAARTSSANEAAAHAMNVNGAARPAKTAARTSSANEAAAHAMNVNAAARPAKTAARTSAIDEARVHAMSVRIIYDPSKDEYSRVQ